MKKQEERTYFRTVRLRSGLTQSDVAFLTGRKHHDNISKLESRVREPSLSVLMAYRVIFQARLKDLMPGHLTNHREEITMRAKELLQKLASLPESPSKDARIRMIKRIIEH